MRIGVVTFPGSNSDVDALNALSVAGVRERYIEAYERITGASFERYLKEDVVAR